MPDKDQEDIEEVKEETPKPEEITGDDFVDESNPSIAEFLGEPEITEEEESKDEVELPKEEEEPVEDTTEDQEPIVEDKPEQPIEEVIKKTTEETIKNLGLTKEEKKELEDEGFKFAWEDRGEDRPASWREQSEETIRLWNYQLQKKQEALSVEQQAKVIEAEQKNKEANAYWDEQLEELRADGLLPQIAPEIKKKIADGKVLSKQDRNDAGLKAQLEVFEKMYELAQQRELEGKKPITDIHHIYHRFLANKSKQPAGATAPVSGGSKTVPQTQSDEIRYEDIHNVDFSDLINS